MAELITQAPWSVDTILDAWGKYTMTGTTRLGLKSVQGNTYQVDDMIQCEYWVESIPGWRKVRQVMVHVHGRGGCTADFPYTQFGFVFGAAISRLGWVDIAAEIARKGQDPKERLAPTLYSMGYVMAMAKASEQPFLPVRFMAGGIDYPPTRHELEAFERSHGHPHPYWGPSQDYRGKRVDKREVGGV